MKQIKELIDVNYKTAAEIIKSRRKNELLMAEQLFVDALRQYPQLRHAENEYKALMSDKNTGKPISGESIRLAAEKKNTLLKELGLQADLIPPPRCIVCSDTGTTADGKPCACVIRLIAATDNYGSAYASAFSDCDFSVFAEKDREKAAAVYEKMKGFCEIFPTKNKLNILLYGKTGTGKTFLASCVADSLNKKGFSAVMTSSFGLVNRMLAYHTAPAPEKLEHIAPLLDCDLLIIDDLGTESMLKNVTVEYFYNVLNERMRARRHTMITTNLDDGMIAARYGERVASRLFDKRLSMGFVLGDTDLRKR